MAHFDHFNLHWRRVHHPAFHRDDVVTPGTDSSSNTPSPTSQSLIIPVAPTIIGDPFTTITTPTPSPSPPPIQSTATTPTVVSPSLTPSSLSLSLTSTTASTTSTSSSSPILSTPTTTSTTSQSSSTPTTTPTFIQTIVNPSGVHTSTVSPSPTSSSTPVSGTSTGIIVGGIIAAILGSAGILAAVVYFLRKCRGRQDEAFSEEIWNRSDARRQSAALGADAEPVRPYGAPPRPPSMIERHLNNTPSMPPRQPTLPNVYPNNAYGNGHGATNYSQNSFSPGHVVSPNSANPFFSPYAQDVMASPVSSTVPEYYDPPHSWEPCIFASSSYERAADSHSPVVSSPDAADPHYTDLSRSSVTPFQAAQYAEITEKLGAPMSSVLGTVSEERQAAVSDNMAAPSYDDPSTRGSDDELPLPSPNAFNQTRIPSLPPTLPEIHVPERSFSPVASLEFPVPLSVRSSPSSISAEFSDLRGPPPSEPNHKSSPLATSTPMRAQEQSAVIPREPKTGAAPANRPDTVYTVYDEEDAYGGF
ncbi:hypothetical protein EDB92DRAFT_2111070 [Lactarius akahatsu]|uniref:Uncharacterized protein n=1 Tax=Lactarius akahatsu TaxID=416441 RepID=A0AAD4LSF7_9AGAM|nr:hypothetical protein EDB92DRAFT_2111070 [Lactarius akahatsu]